MNEPVYDVAVVGAGMAGISAAWHLAQRMGVDSIVVVADKVPRGGTGICHAGFMDHPNRIASGIGREATIELLRYVHGGVRVAEGLALASGAEVTAKGSYSLAVRPTELQDLQESIALYQEAGIGADLVDETLDGTGGRPRGLGALRIPSDVTLRPPHILRDLQAKLSREGTRFELDWTVDRVVEEDDGISVIAGDRTIRAQTCVLACGPHAARLHPFFDPCILPIRAQGFVAVLPEGGASVLDAPLRANWGHEMYLVRGTRFIAVGMRPDLGPGDMGFDETPTEGFQTFLERFAHERIPSLPSELEVERRFAGTVALPSDGLPVVGPLPGSARLLASTGFGFLGLALAAAAGRSLADLLTGGAHDIPSGFSPRRFA